MKKTFVRVGLISVLGVIATSFGCKAASNVNLSERRSAAENSIPIYRFEVINTFPHDPDAFTQGLVFYDGKLLESTGQQGKSSLREVELETGKVLRRVDLPGQYFAEGITLLTGKIYQLTWQDQLGFIYDAASFQKLGEFKYQGEGWGLANDGESLILSDGTSRIRFLDPVSFRVVRTITVYDKQRPVSDINELEFIQGEIYANIWHEGRIARINPQTGRVVGWIELEGLVSRVEVHDAEAVLNGIAYDDRNNRLFVTGKLWPKLFEIRLKL